MTNTGAKCQKGSLVVMVKGVQSQQVISILDKMPLPARNTVKEVTTDLASNMEKIARMCFPEAALISDRFHVQQLPSQAVQEMRIKHRWEAIAKENEAVKKAKEQKLQYVAPCFENGDTAKQLLARSRYLLFKPENKWTEKQQQRATILFAHYPDIKKGYELSMMLRSVYQLSKTKNQAEQRLKQWYDKVDQYEFPSFITAANSIKAHQPQILNFFINRSTNALAENFNGKIKAFRAVFRGVRDIPFFLYRVSLIFA